MTEAEYVAASDVAKEVIWLNQLADTFRQADPRWTLVILSDIQGVVALAKNPVHHDASKHIEIMYHFIWDCVIKESLAWRSSPQMTMSRM